MFEELVTFPPLQISLNCGRAIPTLNPGIAAELPSTRNEGSRPLVKLASVTLAVPILYSLYVAPVREGFTEKANRFGAFTLRLDKVLRTVERIRRAESCKIDAESVVRIAPLSYKGENCMQSR